jgi:hypothetical protein
MILVSNWLHACRKAVQFAEGGLSQFPDSMGDAYTDLSRKVDLKKFHLPWVLRTLLVNPKSEKVPNSKPILTEPMEHRLVEFERVVGGDK